MRLAALRASSNTIEKIVERAILAALEARVILRALFGEKVRVGQETDGSSWAEYTLRPSALLKAAGVGTDGSGGRI